MTRMGARRRSTLLGLVLAVGVAGSASPAAGSPTVETAATATKTYVNTPSGLKGDLRRHYVDFSFRYPSAWTRVPRRQDPLNFVKVVSDTRKAGFEAENFAVGWFRGGLRVAPALLDQINADLRRGFPAYKRLSTGRTRFGRYAGYQLRFSSRVVQGGATTRIWGRVVLVANPSGGNGATVIMLASSASPVVRRVADVGVKGELPGVVRSFRFG